MAGGASSREQILAGWWPGGGEMVRTKDSEVVGGMTLLRGGGMVRTNEAIGSGNGVRENKGGGRRRREVE